VTAPLTSSTTTPTSDEIIWHWLREGWKYRGVNRFPKAKQKRYADRIKYEMGLIVDKRFVDYFLMISDVIRATKDAGIPVGPARGSAAASLVCYLLRITEIDPMDYPLMIFERFIDPNRMDEPDVDTDFDDDYRDFARQHMIKKYGVNRVGNIGTFTRYRGKNAIDDVARVFQVPFAPVERAKEFLVERSGGDTRFDAGIRDTVEMVPQVKEVFDKYPDLYKAMDLEGNLKGFGVHAAGIVVGAEDLSEYVATYQRDNVGASKKTVQVLSVDKYDGAHLGLMKLDALGLKTMGVLRICLELTGMTLPELYQLSMEDEKSLLAFNKADVTGIFQFEGRTMRMVTQEMRPNTFMDLSAINALSRPGPLHSGTTGDYIGIRHGRLQREDLHPYIAQVCEETEGQIIYQEQILQIVRTLGNFPWTSAAAIRKIISNKQGESAFNQKWEEFRVGCLENGVEEEQARKIWKKLVTAGAYSFNIAHCISYSMLGMWSMYFKVHHPNEFYTAQLRKNDKEDKYLPLMRDMQDARYGRSLEVLPPHPQESTETWVPTAAGVRAGFAQIPGIGPAMSERIQEAIGAGMQLEEWEDLIVVRGIGAKTVEKIAAFSAKADPFGISWVKDRSASIKSWIKTETARYRRQGMSMNEIELLEQIPPMPDTTADQVPYEDKESHHIILGVLKARNLQDLFENHRSRTGEELDPETVRDAHLKDSMTLYVEDETGTMTVKVNRWCYPKMKDELWGARLGHDFVLARVYKKPFFGKTITVKRDGLFIIDPD
jgi:DNA polymerase-3 subunit alpha